MSSNINTTMESLGLQDSDLKFPTSHNRVTNFDPKVIRQDALGTRIVVHKNFPLLVGRFLTAMRGSCGNENYRQLYHHPWVWTQQVRRLVEKRPITFLTSRDSTLFRDGHYKMNGAPFWDSVGEESADLSILEDNLSYEEIMLGSLLAVSGPSYFINDGGRYNQAEPGTPGTFETRGIIVGLVGPRFERLKHMDSNLIINGQGRMAPYLKRIFQLHLGVEEPSNPAGFDVEMYKARIGFSLELLLLEANDRAQEAGRKAYVYVVGLGLGVWMYDSRQPDFYTIALGDTLDRLKGKLGHVATVELAYVNAHYKNQEILTKIGREQGIKVKFGKRNPAAKLEGEEAGQLLVLSYAWDGNSFPGNEYWLGNLTGSGDPAAACMSTIAELHNPMVNPKFLDRIHVLESPEFE
ncbi:hypothetical protein F4781DRAFT_335244 [Annulohypoxylon bovei var. microspora]|nr:hypothetical protein F4781DRAFT_335244 [Annulohypoxylon bovei var. microspora]